MNWEQIRLTDFRVIDNRQLNRSGIYHLTLSKILEDNGIEDCLRAFGCFFGYFDKSFEDELKIIAMKTAVFTAKKVLPLWTDKFPDDDRPEKAIEAAEDYLANPTKEAASIVLIAGQKAANACEAAEAVREMVAAHAAHAIAYATFSSSAVHTPYANYAVIHAAHCYSETSAKDAYEEIKSYLQRLLTERSL